ncbi:hypothetical protein EVAR_7430_1 [Eumeta japonica]|uniref:Uncharacterized protein n=1 Tax=Eumeta variegata TaxID=151549 RepID=A0A4C1V7T2_EUMVA|nr:hypothetical protein EVAR_7430_1 [Eumeta japonica]
MLKEKSLRLFEVIEVNVLTAQTYGNRRAHSSGTDRRARAPLVPATRRRGLDACEPNAQTGPWRNLASYGPEADIVRDWLLNALSVSISIVVSIALTSRTIETTTVTKTRLGIRIGSTVKGERLYFI